MACIVIVTLIQRKTLFSFWLSNAKGAQHPRFLSWADLITTLTSITQVSQRVLSGYFKKISRQRVDDNFRCRQRATLACLRTHARAHARTHARTRAPVTSWLVMGSTHDELASHG